MTTPPTNAIDSVVKLSDWPSETLANQRVITRVDFNVPLLQDGTIGDDTRIRRAVPTIQYLVNQKAAVIILSHLGRPTEIADRYRLQVVIPTLAKYLGKLVQYCDAPHDSVAVRTAVDALKPGDVLVLENTRFNPKDKANDSEFSKLLASFGDRFVFDAFGVAHRNHASTTGIANYLPSCIGPLVSQELTALTTIISESVSPKLAIIGGSKISTKLGVLQNLLGRVDQLIIGGAMMFTLLKAAGHQIGSSLYEPDLLPVAQNFLIAANHSRTTVYIPEDSLIAPSIDATESQTCPSQSIPDDYMGLDIGPISTTHCLNLIAQAKSIVWNGPMGAFEWHLFSTGTHAIATAISQSDATSLVGGGDSLRSIRNFMISAHQFTHVSTGGGASLAVLEGRVLPVITAMQH